MRFLAKNTIGLFAAAIFLGACATHTVKTTSYTPVIQDSQNVPEDLLLDVGVAMFDPGLDELDRDQEELTNPQIRVAESRYAPYQLATTLQRSANWGIVRLMPNDSSPMDVYITGTILESNGESMAMRIHVADSTGSDWYTKVYNQEISQFSYDPSQRQQNDPFQILYNNIANDLLAWKKENISDEEVTAIRTVSEMLFAQRFSPDIFDSYLTTDRDGVYQITSLPADSDPVLNRIRDIRERDFEESQDYCNYLIRGCEITYNMDYQINAPNDFIKKAWSEENV